MPSIIVEICFVEATEDVKLYRTLGSYKVAQDICRGITGLDISNKEKEIRYDMKNLVCYCNQIDKRAAEYLADHLQCPSMDANLPYNYDKVAENLYAVGGGDKFSSYTTKNIKGNDRYETVKEVLKFIGKL